MISDALFGALLADTDFVAVDVGASHWLPPHWQPYQSTFPYVLVEPDGEACRDLEARAAAYAKGRFQIVEAALSGAGGPRTLYRFNTPTWSSLLPPGIREGDERLYYHWPRIDDPSLIHPVVEVPIGTRTLADVLTETGQPGFHMVKLDTQGTELEIILGLGDRLQDTVLVQMEAGDHDLYQDKPGLGETLTAMKAAGYRLFDMQLARTEPPFRGTANGFYQRDLFPSPTRLDPAFVGKIHEVDAVFVRDPIQALERGDAAALRRTIVALCVYRLFAEAYQITGLGAMRGLWTDVEASLYRRDIIRCHKGMKHKIEAGFRLYWERP